MKKVISMLAILVMTGGLCVGCKNKEADESKPEATQQLQESDTKGWELETSKQSTTDDTHDDHSGHNH